MKKISMIIAVMLVAVMAVFMLSGCGLFKADTEEVSVTEEAVPQSKSAKNAKNVKKVKKAVSTAKKAASTVKKTVAAQNQSGTKTQSSTSTGIKTGYNALDKAVNSTVSNAIDTLKPSMTNPGGAWESYGKGVADQWENFAQSQGDYWSNAFK